MLGFWQIKDKKSIFMSHSKGLAADQIAFLHSLQVGDKLVLFTNDVREGEHGAHLTLKRSTKLAAE